MDLPTSLASLREVASLVAAASQAIGPLRAFDRAPMAA